MTKKITPLEALRRIRDYENLPSRNPVLYLLEQENLPTYYKVIETALKEQDFYKNQFECALEAIKNNQEKNDKTIKWYQDTGNDFFRKTINQLKTLEIIKKLFKGHINIDYDEKHEFYEIWTSNDYEDVFVIASGQGKEEYELIKELLL